MSGMVKGVLWRVSFAMWSKEPCVVAPEGASLDTIVGLARLGFNDDRPLAKEQVNLNAVKIERVGTVVVDAAVMRLRSVG